MDDDEDDASDKGDDDDDVDDDDDDQDEYDDIDWRSSTKKRKSATESHGNRPKKQKSHQSQLNGQTPPKTLAIRQSPRKRFQSNATL